MLKFKDNIFKIIIVTGTAISSLVVLLVFFYILKESMPLLSTYKIGDLLLGKTWAPISVKETYSFLPMILATLYISFLAVLFAVPFGVGCAFFLCFCLKKEVSKVILSFIDMLAGIPSVIFGFLGLILLVKFMEQRFDMVTGESVLAGAILLSIMLLPYIVTGCSETLYKGKEKYMTYSLSLGVSKWYTLRKIILPFCSNSIFVNMLLAFGRAMGETMAVMMVIGNAPIIPKLFGKAQTLPSLIALEMGTATYNSMHYSALYTAGLILVVLLLLTQFFAHFIKKISKGENSDEN